MNWIIPGTSCDRGTTTTIVSPWPSVASSSPSTFISETVSVTLAEPAGGPTASTIATWPVWLPTATRE
jgi:hypothetical protein